MENHFETPEVEEEKDPQDFSLLSLVDQHMERDALTEYPKRSWWATDGFQILPIGKKGILRTFGKCPRESVMRMLGMGPGWDPSATAQRSFDLGHWFEAGEVRYHKELGIWRGNNVKVFDVEHDVSGEYDEIVEIDKNMILVEFKSATGFFKNKEVIKNGHVSDGYLFQVGFYLYTGQHMFKHGARLVYWVAAGDKIQLREFYIDRDEEWNIWLDYRQTRFNVLKILEGFDTIRTRMNEGFIPARGYWENYPADTEEALIEEGLASESSKGDWNCRYCTKCQMCRKLPTRKSQSKKHENY